MFVTILYQNSPKHHITKSRTSQFTPDRRFSAVFVFHDPRNWALDIQVVCDILQNDGFILPRGTEKRKDPNSEEAVKLFFCNPDLQWGTDYPSPRLGQGAFKLALQSVYKALTGGEYPYTQYGKPSKATYAYAEQLVREYLKGTVRGDDTGQVHTPHM